MTNCILLIFPMFCQCEREFHVGCLKKHKMADLRVCAYAILVFSFYVECIVFMSAS